MKKNRHLSTRRFKPLIRYLAWSQIVIQGLMPTALAFTPVVMAADKPAVTYEQSQLLPSLTVPVASSSVKTSTTGTNSTDTQSALAQNAKIMAGLASGDDSASAAQQFAVGQVTQKATQEVENWLNQYGNARISMNTNASDDFNMDGSSFDFLLPVWDQKNALTFMQFDTHYQGSDRLIGNVGVGQRFFFDSGWMLGVNAFYDQELTGTASRAGIGGELWADNFKFSGNGYFAISDWHNSDELDDYDEKAANGFDLQVDGYLPSYPQLGGKLKYEKYFGNNVALFGSDHLQNNPSAVTVGLNYTPVPLITAGMDYKTGQDDQDELQLKLDFSYALGVPWSEQISSDAVTFRRSLAGSRMDFVNRNNDIVMQYRKQDVISLGLPDHLTGDVLSSQALKAVINAKYGAKEIKWDPSSTLLTAGGKITTVDVSHYMVTMPSTAGEFRLRGIAYDRKGNPSNLAETVFTANQASLKSSLAVDSTKLAVNQKATYTLTVTDASGTPVSGATIAWSKDLGNFISTPPATTDASGNAIAALTSTTPGVAHVSATTNGGVVTKAPDVTFTADSSKAKVTTLTLAAPKSVVANGSDKLTYTATVVDANNNPVVDQSVSWTSTVGTPASTTSTTNAQGQATMTVSSTVEGSPKVTASTNNTSLDNSEGQFTANTSTATVTMLTLADPKSVAANGSDKLTYTATIVDANKNPLANQSVSWATTVGNVASATSATNAQGQAVMTISSTTVGAPKVTASINGTSLDNSEGKFTADSATAKVTTLTLADPKSVVANGTDKLTYIATVVDANNNPLSSQSVSWASTVGTPANATSSTDTDGHATVTVSSTVAGTPKVTASINGTSVDNSEGQFTVDSSSAAVSTLEVTPTTELAADGTSRFTFTATVKNAAGDPVPDVTVNWDKDSTNALFASVSSAKGRRAAAVTSTTDDNGIAQITLTDTTAESVNVMAQVGSTAAQSKAVTFIADVNTVSVALTANPVDNVAVNDGSAILTATLTDANGNPMPNALVTWSSTSTTVEITGDSAQTSTTNAQGIATATVKDSVVETATFKAETPKGSGVMASQTTTVKFVANTSNLKATLAAKESSVTAGDTGTTLTATVTSGSSSTALQGATVDWTAITTAYPGVTLSASTSTTDASGEATVTIKDTKAETVSATVNASISGSTVTSNKADITFTADQATAKITLSADPADNVKANGTTASTLTATVVDANGNPISTAITWSTDKGTLTNQQTPSDATTGKATATLTDTTAEQVTVTAAIATGTTKSATASVNFIADMSHAVLSLNAAPTSVVADGTTTSTVTAKVVDGAGNGIAGVVVTLDNGGKGTLSKTSITTGADGTATATLTDTTAEQVTINASIPEGATKAATATVEFTQSGGVAASVTLSAPAQAYWTDYKISGANKQMLIATVKDANGDPVTGGTVTLKPATSLTAQVENSGTPDSSGNVTVDVESATASAGYTLEACTTGTNSAEVCSDAVTLPFYDPPTVTVDHLIGDTSKISIPADRLQAGEAQLKASGGDGSYSGWTSSDSSAISVDSTGKATMVGKGAADITVTSLGRTGTLSVPAASQMLFINTSIHVVYSDAVNTAGSAGLPMKDAVKSITDEWGGRNISAYSAYSSHTATLAVWTGDVTPAVNGTASTYDIVSGGFATSVDPGDASGYAAYIN